MDDRSNNEPAAAYGQHSDRGQKQGRLKIFLGYASGVGKTYAMLEAAQQRLDEGLDVVAGFLETHGQPETEALLAGLEIIPRRLLNSRGVTEATMDLDGLLARRPDIALVDELAYSNPPGARHGKRYQDVQELLDAGIDVYTTLNIQHLESLNDVVSHITEVAVEETVPDQVLDEANEIELIDLPIGELLQRLEEGRMALPAEVEPAWRRFFRPGNLAALRELTLRRAADRIDEQMRAYMQSHDIRGPWPAAERLLVCVSPSPLAERLVRSARRLASRLNAEWYAVYVETPGHAGLSDMEQDRVARVLRLAEGLGGRSMRLPGHSVAETITGFARSYNISKIVAGRPLQSRWQDLLRGSIVDQIIRHSQDIDVYVISARPRQEVPKTAPVTQMRRHRTALYLRGAGLVLLVTLLGLPLRSIIEPSNLVMLYLLAVIVTALRLGRRPAVVASLLSVIVFDLVFVPPYYTFVVADAQYLLTFAGLLGVGLIISGLAANAREQARFARRREANTAVLYELSRDLAAAAELRQVTETIVRHVEQIVSSRAAVFIDGGAQPELSAASPDFPLDDKEVEVAAWTFAHREAAGQGTGTLASARGFYLPLKTARAVVGVLGVVFAGVAETGEPAPVEPVTGEPMTAEQRRLLESFASQAAIAIERSLLAEKAQEAQLLQETEKLQTALLNSISHDLRTPLASITGTLSSLHDDGALLDGEARQELLANAYQEAERLNHLVGNLLDMTRLEADVLKIRAVPVDIEDVVGVALSSVARRLGERELLIEIPPGLPLVPADFVLLVQVLVNLLDNADKYAPPGSPLTIRSRHDEQELLVQILDRGPGIAAGEAERIFEKFYRAEGTRLSQGDRLTGARPGTGLGLSICKGIIEAHHGRIWAKNRPGGGAVFTVALPLPGQELLE